jgi:hypothetical protein
MDTMYFLFINEQFFPDQGRTRVYGEAYSLYAAAENPRRTQILAKKAIYGWKLVIASI